LFLARNRRAGGADAMAVESQDDYLDVALKGDICEIQHRDWGKD
jgi:hypothetical protein